MLPAKAILGKYSNIYVDVDDPEVNKRFCKKSLVYCDHCKQWVHLRAEKSLHKKTHFAHYNVIGKHCIYRTSSTENWSYSDEQTLEDNQHLKEIQEVFGNLFISLEFKSEIERLKESKKYSAISNRLANWFTSKDLKASLIYQDNHNCLFNLIEILSIELNKTVLENIIIYAIIRAKEYLQEDHDDKVKEIILSILNKFVKEHGYIANKTSKNEFVERQKSISEQRIVKRINKGIKKKVLDFKLDINFNLPPLPSGHISLVQCLNYAIYYYPIQNKVEQVSQNGDLKVSPIISKELEFWIKSTSGKYFNPLGFVVWEDKSKPKFYNEFGLLIMQRKKGKVRIALRVIKGIALGKYKNVSEEIENLKRHIDSPHVEDNKKVSLRKKLECLENNVPIHVLVLINKLGISHFGDVLKCKDPNDLETQKFNWQMLFPELKLKHLDYNTTKPVEVLEVIE